MEQALDALSLLEEAKEVLAPFANMRIVDGNPKDEGEAVLKLYADDIRRARALMDRLKGVGLSPSPLSEEEKAEQIRALTAAESALREQGLTALAEVVSRMLHRLGGEKT